MTKKIYALIMIILILIGGIIFSLRNNKIVDIEEPITDTETLPDDRMEEVEFSLYNQDRSVTWKLNSANLNRYNKQGLLELDVVEIIAYDMQDNELYTISAGSSTMDAGNNITLEDSVEVHQDQRTITAEKILWQQNNDIIEGTGGIVIKSPPFLITGQTFTSNSKLSKLTVNGNKDKQAFFSWEEKESNEKSK